MVWLEMKQKWLFFFYFFLGMLQSGSGRNGTRNEFFFFFGSSRPDLDRNETRMTFFKFLEFFWECINSRREKRYPEWKFFFLFFFFTCPSPISQEMKPKWFFFLIFKNILLIFFKKKTGECSSLGWAETIFEMKKNFILFFYVSWPGLARNEAKMNFFNFFGNALARLG